MKLTIELEDKDLLGLSESTMVALFRTVQTVAAESTSNHGDENRVMATPEGPADTAEPEKVADDKTEDVTEDKPKKRRTRKVETKAEEVAEDKPAETQAPEPEPVAEKPKEEKPSITQEELKHYCAEQCKTHAGFSSKLRKLINDEFKVEKLSAVKPEDYQKFHDRVAELVKEL